MLAGRPEPHSPQRRIKNAVRDHDILKIEHQPRFSPVGAQCNAVIPRLNVTVFNPDIGAAVRITAVSVRSAVIIADADIGNCHIAAGIRPDRPVSGIAERYAVDADVLTLQQSHHLAGTPAVCISPVRAARMNLSIQIEERGSVAVDDPLPRNGNILLPP